MKGPAAESSRRPAERGRRVLRGLLALVTVLPLACADETVQPVPQPDLRFAPDMLDLGQASTGTLVLGNHGIRAEGPVELGVSGVRNEGGVSVLGAIVRLTPAEVPTLQAGGSRTVHVRVDLAEPLPAGEYRADVLARLFGRSVASAELRFRIATPGGGGPVASVRFVDLPGELLQGDVVHLRVEALDPDGVPVVNPTPAWSVSPADAGLLTANGRFVGYRPGTVTLVATLGGAADTVVVEVGARGLSGSFEVVGRGEVSARYTSDLWIVGDHAYSGTWGQRATPAGARAGNRAYAWDISNPANPILTDSVSVDARVVNDVKVRPDGRFAVITHELSNDGLNGVSLLDLSDPARPQVIRRFTQGLESGIHNVWIDGDHVYLVVDGVGNGLRVMDVSDPTDPRIVASFYAGTSFLHDVYVRDGLAFLSHWDAGLVILDVGNGVRGGSPANPVEVGRLADLGGQTHNAWYWPEAGYVFVGEEDYGTPGFMHVVDVSDMTRPREVATFKVPGATPHNFWLDEDRGILYLAWYGNGLRALDVTGELLGSLELQGREIAGLRYEPSGTCSSETGTCTWAPQLHRGLVWVSDMNHGILSLRPLF